MRILALEPYYGGSHRAFLDGWVAHSRHEWTVLELPAYKWKWRMRHAAITLADRVAALRVAFHSAITDPAFIAAAERIRIEVNEVDSDTLIGLITAAYAMPPAIVEAAREAMNLSGSTAGSGE